MKRLVDKMRRMRTIWLTHNHITGPELDDFLDYDVEIEYSVDDNQVQEKYVLNIKLEDKYFTIEECPFSEEDVLELVSEDDLVNIVNEEYAEAYEAYEEIRAESKRDERRGL